AGQTVELRVLGLATVADDVSAELARATIAAVEVLGAFRASKEVKAAPADRSRRSSRPPKGLPMDDDRSSALPSAPQLPWTAGSDGLTEALEVLRRTFGDATGPADPATGLPGPTLRR